MENPPLSNNPAEEDLLLDNPLHDRITRAAAFARDKAETAQQELGDDRALLYQQLAATREKAARRLHESARELRSS